MPVRRRIPKRPVAGHPSPARLAVLLLGCANCGGGDRPVDSAGAPESAEWTLAGPMVEIGVAEGDPEDELHDVADAVRLEDGRVVVLDGGTAQLRMFDSEGVFLAAAGGRGEGPGEFRRPARIHLTHPDSMLVDDPVLQRTSRFDTGGRFIWSEPWPQSDAPFPRDVWVYGRHLVDGPRQPELRGIVRAVLDGLPRPSAGGYRLVAVDAAWRLWIRAEPHDPATVTLWTVRDIEGRQIAHVRLPAHMRPTHFGADFVVGVLTDSLGVERVRVYAVEGAPEAASPPVRTGADGPEPAPREVGEEAVRRMTDALRVIQAAQEIHYARPSGGSGYAGSIAMLEIEPAALEGVEAHIVAAGPRGYTVLVFDEREPAGCALTVGIGGPIGWTPGVALCG